MLQNRLLTILSLTLVLAPLVSQRAFGQASTTLFDPLVSGAQSSAPFIPASPGLPPAIGSGSIPLPVNPGMLGPSTLLPWVPAIPSNTINSSSSGIGLPVSPSIASPPGVLGPLLTPVIPSEPSTPGVNPGILTAPIGSFNPALQTTPGPIGGLPGTGGYATTIPKIRRSGQTTTQYELRGRQAILGGGGNSQDEVTQLGYLAGYGVPYGVPTGNGYNNVGQGLNTSNRNSSIDLGGGLTTKVGGVKIPIGSGVQDYGASALRGNGIGALSAHQSTEFGQGLRREPIASSHTTEFGLPYKQFNVANVGIQDSNALLPPSAIETNF
jgi:hypothetical protein